MSTISYIVKKLNDNEYKSIYCHFDGYLDGVGQVLLDNYNSEKGIDSILELGDMSRLGETPTACDTYKNRGEDNTEAVITPLNYLIDDYYINFVYVWDIDHYDVYRSGTSIGVLTQDLINSEG